MKQLQGIKFATNNTLTARANLKRINKQTIFSEYMDNGTNTFRQQALGRAIGCR